MSKMRAKGTPAPRKRKPRRTQASPGAPARRFPVMPTVFVALALLLILAITLSGGGSTSDEERVAAVAGEVTIDGDGLAPYILGSEDTAIGETAPTFSGVDFDNAPVSVEHDGTPKAVLFLAHWCVHCQAEVPRVQEWLASGGGVPGVEMISVVTSYDPPRGNWPPQDWLEREDWPLPVVRDTASSAAYAAYGAGGFPFWVFLDGNGTVVNRISGETSIAELEAQLVALTTT